MIIFSRRISTSIIIVNTKKKFSKNRHFQQNEFNDVILFNKRSLANVVVFGTRGPLNIFILS